MEKYMPEEVFEGFVRRLRNKFPKLTEEKVRELAMLSLKEEGASVGLPLTEQIRQAQVETAERMVVNNLHRDGMTGENLLRAIKTAQVEAGEQAVVRNLRKLGLSRTKEED